MTRSTNPPVIYLPTVVGGEHFVFGSSFRPSVSPLTPISRDTISHQLLEEF